MSIKHKMYQRNCRIYPCSALKSVTQFRRRFSGIRIWDQFDTGWIYQLPTVSSNTKASDENKSYVVAFVEYTDYKRVLKCSQYIVTSSFYFKS